MQRAQQNIAEKIHQCRVYPGESTHAFHGISGRRRPFPVVVFVLRRHIHRIHPFHPVPADSLITTTITTTIITFAAVTPTTSLVAAPFTATFVVPRATPAAGSAGATVGIYEIYDGAHAGGVVQKFRVHVPSLGTKIKQQR